MRSIITVSAPPSVKRRVDDLMKENKYASISELFREALGSLENVKLIKSIEESELEFVAGKGKKLRSLKDLM